MLTSNGFEIKRLPVILEELATAQKLIFTSLNLDPSSPDGQVNGIIGELLEASYVASLAIYNGMDPRVAAGIMLDRVCAITGIERLDATPTIADVTFTGLALTLIPAGSLVLSSLIPNVKFSTVEDVTIQLGETTATVEVLATAFGPLIVSAAEIDTLDQVPTGITSVTNAIDGITGREIETDQQLRIRREKSVAILSQALIDSIYARVANTEGVTDVKIYENRTSAIDSKLIDPHSIWVIVKGGLDDGIADAIMSTVSTGPGFKGAEVVAWEDSSGFSHDVQFDRAAETDIFVDVSIVSPNYNPAFATEIKQKIVDYVAGVRAGTEECSSGKFSIADVVYASALYAAIIGSDDYTISGILIGLTSPGTLQSIALDYDEIAAFEIGNIDVTVLP